MTNALTPFDDEDPAETAVYGLVIGLIAQIEGDPDALNRVLVSFPVLGVDSAWARVASFYAGPQKGAFFFPAQGDEVLILFEGGDVSRPYVIGVLWNGVDTPCVTAEQLPMVRELRTASGARLRFDDTEGAARITVTDQAGNTVLIDSAANKITLSAVQDLALTAPGQISITGGQVSIAATQTLALKSDGEGSCNVTGTLRLQGAEIFLN